MSTNDRCDEALNVLRQGGTIPGDHPAVREEAMRLLQDGSDGIRFPSREFARAIRDHNNHLDPYAEIDGDRDE